MRTLNDLHEAFAVLEAQAPTRLSDAPSMPARSRNVRRIIALVAAVAAVAAIVVSAPWAVIRLSDRDGAPAEPNPGPGLTSRLIAPKSLIGFDTFGFHVAGGVGGPAIRWDVDSDGQSMMLDWDAAGGGATVWVGYQGEYDDERPASAQSVSVHGADGYYAVENDEESSTAELVWEYAQDSWARVSVSDSTGGILRPEAEMRARLLAIAEAVRPGGPSIHLPFRVGARPANLPPASAVSVTNGNREVFARIEFGDSAATSLHLYVDIRRFSISSSCRGEPFTYRGHEGCLDREPDGEPVNILTLNVDGQERGIRIPCDDCSTWVDQYPLDDVKRLLAELTVASEDPATWFPLQTALGVR